MACDRHRELYSYKLGTTEESFWRGRGNSILQVYNSVYGSRKGGVIEILSWCLEQAEWQCKGAYMLDIPRPHRKPSKLLHPIRLMVYIVSVRGGVGGIAGIFMYFEQAE